MPAFLVKHMVADQGPAMANLKDLRRTPYSFTSRDAEAKAAALGNFVYVVEVHRDKQATRYLLAYKYKAYEVFRRPGTALWKDGFKFKNSAIPGEHADGAYFESPVEITDSGMNDWLEALPTGMAELPQDMSPALDALIDAPENSALDFA